MKTGHSQKNENGRKEKSTFRKVLGFFLLFIFALIVIAGGWFYFKYGRQLLELRKKAQAYVASSTTETFRASQTSICYYSDGSIMQLLSAEKDVYYLPYSSIPAYAVNAVLSVEDRKFFSHSGYDIYAIARAARSYLVNDGEIRQGGSTITQQLARCIFLNNEKTIERKVTEIFIASELEKKYSKYDILEFYLNNIYFANGYYGLQAAAKGYFNRTADSLSLSETAFLCAIPNNPSDYDPRTRFENTLERRDSVLKQMYENNAISAEEYNSALAEEIVLSSPSKEKNNYEETYSYYCAVRAIMQTEGFVLRYSFADDEDRKIYEEEYYNEYYRVRRNLYTKGYRIYTSINPQKQELLQKAIDAELADFTETNGEGIYKLQAAAACIDNETGLVVAIIGGRGQESADYTLNRAYQSPRQPGSSIKPLLVYTPAFEAGYWPDSIVNDERFSGGPRNSESVYSGEIELRYAVAVSKNTIAWKLFEELGIVRCMNYLKKLQFGHLVDSDYVPAASLGGLTYGTTAVELSSGYAALANGGIFRTPSCILRITDAKGEAIVDNTSLTAERSNLMNPTRVYDSNASRIMTDVLQTVMQTGTGKKLRLDRVSCAGKTGTTTNQKDGWFAGYTPYYTTAVWVGYDLPEKMDDLRGNTYPGRIWNAFMNEIHETLPDRAFEDYYDPRPPKVEETEEDEYSEENPEETDESSEDNPKEAGEESGEDNEGEPEEDLVWVSPGDEDGRVWISP